MVFLPGTLIPIKSEIPSPWRHIAPKRCDIAPARCDIAPERCDFDPKKCELDSKRCELDPKRCDLDPGWIVIAPKRCVDNPMKSEFASFLMDFQSTLIYSIYFVRHQNPKYLNFQAS
jgi:hypothetical protein